MSNIQLWQFAGIIAGGLITLFSFSFAIFWKIISDVKKSAHARIDRIEKDSKEKVNKDQCETNVKVFSDSVNRLDQTVIGFRTEVTSQISNLTGRIDTLISMNGGPRSGAH